MSEYIEIKGLENFFKACDKLIDMDKHGQSLKPATIKQKIKDGKNKGILKRDGDLSNALNWQSEPTKSGVEVFNNIQTKNGFKYGYVHQWGNRKRKIPQRAFLPIDNNKVLHPSIRSVIYKDTKDFIVKIVKK
ncbi:TPA: virion morphogenesis protein [Campylobacter jejuni]|nr:virion morphogenesis protein [Campylobacter jejuni]EAI1259523.1 virion morphogenesis protein [Campylobacter jejuni]ECL2497230.1 virion morphogenesis protein [Campylobacter jejuni]EDP4669857.1 virion morphogenesis protein [Campylobacter jejuni]EDP6249619.1 virion morphogenesis protein [Campylobacter jejuni]